MGVAGQGSIPPWHNWLGKHFLNVWNLTLVCVMWLVWKDLNSRTFEESVRSIDQLKSLMLHTSLNGLRHRVHFLFPTLSWIFFIDLLVFFQGALSSLS